MLRLITVGQTVHQLPRMNIISAQNGMAEGREIVMLMFIDFTQPQMIGFDLPVCRLPAVAVIEKRAE
ncbi:hypothetical protein D3C73_997160 [compost metagenome]